MKRRIAGLGLCAALLGAQPGCAHQMTNRDFALGAVAIGLVVGSLVLVGVTDYCKGPATCSRSSGANDLMPTTLGDGPSHTAREVASP